MKYGGKDVAFLLVDGYNLLADTTEISDVSIESIMEETHTLGDSWAESLPVGLKKATFSQDGFYDDAAGTVNAVFADGEATQRTVLLGLTSTRTIGFQGAFGAKYTRKLDRGKIHKAKVVYTVSGFVDEGITLQAPVSKSADFDTEATSTDNLVSTSAGAAAYQQVGLFTGLTGYIGKIRHSPDNITFADLVAFTNVTGANVAERKTVASAVTIERYVAYSGDVTGTGSLTVSSGFSRF